MANGIKNQWVVGVIIAGVIVAIFVFFNYQGNQSKDNSLSAIFPEEAGKVPETEYEFVTDGPAKTGEAVNAPVKAAASAPAAVSAPAKVPAKLPAVAPGSVAAKPAQVTAPAAPSAAAVSGNYSIQVLSSKDKAATDKAFEKIKAKGHAAFIVTKDLGDKGIWYRINIGPYATKQEAENNLSAIKADYKDGFIVYTK